MNTNVYSHVCDSTSAKEAWQNLAKAFEDSGRLTIRLKLCSFKRENPMEAYITEYSYLARLRVYLSLNIL